MEKKTCGSLFIRYNRRMAITRRQKEVIDFLSNFTQKNGYSPSYEEIAHGLGLTSLATVHKHVTNLQNKGLLQRAHNRSRSIDVLPPRSSKKGFDRLPLLGRIAAGKPLEAIETAESISLADIIGNREVFALEVRGDSMRDEHIVSGDYVLVVDNRSSKAGAAAVHLRIALDFASLSGPVVTRLGPRRQFTVIVLAFAFFFGVVTYSARKLLRAVKKS